MTKHLDETNFNDFINSSEKPVLIDFWAPWCAPCKAISPLLDELATSRQDIEVVKVDVDQSKNIAKSFGVRGIPALYIIEKGKIKATKVGAMNKAGLTTWVNSALS